MPYISDKQRFPTHEAAAYYLAAMVDGEGTISGSYHPVTGKLRSRYVSVCNTDLEIIAAVESACRALGIVYVCRTTAPKKSIWKRRFDVIINRRIEIEKFAATVPIQCSRKRKRLAEILESYERAGYGKWVKILTPEFLHEEYTVKGKSYREIAAELNCPVASLAVRVRASGIITRRHHNQYTSREVA